RPPWWSAPPTNPSVSPSRSWRKIRSATSAPRPASSRDPAGLDSQARPPSGASAESGPLPGAVAEVIVDVAAAGIDKPLDYLIPPELQDRLTVGHRVLVPLRGQQVEGFVVGRREYTLLEQLRPILSLLDEQPVLTEDDIDLAEWLSSRFLFLRVDALRCLLPPHSRLRLKGRL